MSIIPPEGPTVPDHLPLALRVEFEADAYRRVRQPPGPTRDRRSRWTRIVDHRMTPVAGSAFALTAATVWAMVARTPMAVTTAVLFWSLGVAALVTAAALGRVAARLDAARSADGLGRRSRAR